MMLIRRRARPIWGLALLCLIVVVFWSRNEAASKMLPRYGLSHAPKQILRTETHDDDNSNRQRVACKGARGVILDADDKKDVAVASQLPGVTFPVPTMGSYDALGLPKTWMSFAQRYGPYGYGETNSPVDWDAVDWGRLQDECASANSARFASRDTASADGPRFRFVNQAGRGRGPNPPSHKTGRQAIILRTWSMYEYHPEDLWNLRSIITEASLAKNGDYQVFLLVDLKCGDECKDVHSNDTMYQELLEQSVPKEFHHMTVLFHETLQRDWYAKVDEYRAIWQIMQPLQLFAHFYPEYDHYWQFEMDTRFTGHAGEMLEAFHNFGRDQPYKQSRERASWAYMPSAHGTYDDFSAHINASLQGGAKVWGPERVAYVDPIGPSLPENPESDDFRIGRGDDADLLLFGQLNDVREYERQEDWMFKDWVFGFDRVNVNDMPRYMSVPAQARASYDLLEAVHRSQHRLGLRIASEATLPSWALWLGLKVVGLPFPKFMYPERKLNEVNQVQNGGLPSTSSDGISHGPGNYRAGSVGFFTKPVTFDWWSSLCDPIFEHWMGTYVDKTQQDSMEWPRLVVVPNERPGFMTEVGGKVYMPSMLLHPRKSNAYVAPG